MFDFLRTYEYHVGIIFEPGNSEFRSNVTDDVREAYEVARQAYKENPHQMHLYVKSGKETKEIPYSQISHLDILSHSRLELEIAKMSKELFKKKK